MTDAVQALSKRLSEWEHYHQQRIYKLEGKLAMVTEALRLAADLPSASQLTRDVANAAASMDDVDAFLARVRAEEREKCAKVAELEAERIKHTSHADGLGMGDLASEDVAHRIAAAIRRAEP